MMGLYAMALYATAEAAFAKLFPKAIERYRTEPGVVYYHAEEVFDAFIAGYNFGRCELIDENTALRTRAEKAERERDDLSRKFDEVWDSYQNAMRQTTAAERERDEARAEVERLQTASVASVDRWMEFVSHFQRLVKSNMGTEAGKLAIGYFKRAAEAGNLDEAGPPTIAPRDAAASERAAIVAMLRERLNGIDDTRREAAATGADLTVLNSQRYECYGMICELERLDHHRDGGG